MVNELENVPRASTLTNEEQTVDPSNNDSQEDISLGDSNEITSLASLRLSDQEMKRKAGTSR